MGKPKIRRRPPRGSPQPLVRAVPRRRKSRAGCGLRGVGRLHAQPGPERSRAKTRRALRPRRQQDTPRGRIRTRQRPRQGPRDPRGQTHRRTRAVRRRAQSATRLPSASRVRLREGPPWRGPGRTRARPAAASALCARSGGCAKTDPTGVTVQRPRHRHPFHIPKQPLDSLGGEVGEGTGEVKEKRRTRLRTRPGAVGQLLGEDD